MGDFRNMTQGVFGSARNVVAGAIALVICLGQGAFAQTEDVLESDQGFVITVDTGSAAPAPTPTPAPVETTSAVPTTSAVTTTPAQVQDQALARADVQITFDGLGVKPRLDVLMLNTTPPRRGEAVRVQSQMNYPAFITRSELRVIDLGARGGARLVQVVALAPNGTASFALPDGRNLAVVHRVYDARGRFDETQPLPLRVADAAPLLTEDGIAPEDGTSTLARRRIPVFGGAVTVRGQNVRAGADVITLGERVTPDPQGSFVLQRILPPGDRPVDVQIVGAGEDTYLERDISIPSSDWFYTGTVDLTYGWRLNEKARELLDEDETYFVGRIAGYAKGRTKTGWTITARVDTGEDDVKNLFRDLDKKDPQSVLLRLMREDSYPTYGDDSSIEDGAPSDGKVYLRAEKNGSHLMWGNFRSEISNSYYLRNERELYGFQGIYRSQNQTTRGQSRVSAEVYAANPDQLPARDVFRGTGGSVYFLQKQDISVGSETLTVQVRDGDTGRVVETQILTEGRDYQINYVQGVITLARPLQGSAGGGTVITNPGGEFDVQLVAQYEYSPVFGDVDGTNYGGRAEAWITDELRIGVTGQVEQTETADQTARGIDLRWEKTARTFVHLEYAETDGPGFDSTLSNTGGLTADTQGAVGGKGAAWTFIGQLDLEDVGAQMPGTIAGYYEKREAGFSTLDYQIADDEELWGVSIALQPRENVKLRFYYDDYHDATGKAVREGGAELTFIASDRLKWDFAVEHLDKETPGGDADETGSRTDIAVRATFTPSDILEWYIYGQATVDRSGGFEDNNRVGAGVRYRFAKNWTFEGDVSDGDKGVAAEALFTYQTEGYDSAYIGYRLEPDRDFAGVDLDGSDQGTWVAGGKRRLSDNVDIFGEATYDIFGKHHALTNAYGVEYRASELLTLFGALEVGTIQDGSDDFDRRAVSVGMRYSDGERLDATARLEYRLDDGEISGENRDMEALFVAASVRYKIDNNQRLLFNFEYADSDTDNSSLLSGTYIDTSLGYALRPVENDRLNLLFRYRYLYDMVGQELDGTTTNRGPRQESHVVSIDIAYDLNQRWTLGAKLGGRWSRSSPSEDVAFQSNDAWLAVVNARYHLTHKWDVLLEARHLEAEQAEFSETSYLGAVYRHIGNNLKLGVGYNFGSFSDDLTDLTYDDEGAFINVIAKF